ncbi:hypothetical protein CEXT_786041 [Caerostris extrusa]|uniref:Uncharacterized protein n=1 Tax=Caerostris extrusa TaxID=172846 RepID=A0AAV4VPQ7_CAEEX|nr:hypothetical protein CEXT_786041 [Caerostris extrusa]
MLEQRKWPNSTVFVAVTALVHPKGHSEVVGNPPPVLIPCWPLFLMEEDLIIHTRGRLRLDYESHSEYRMCGGSGSLRTEAECSDFEALIPLGLGFPRRNKAIASCIVSERD